MLLVILINTFNRLYAWVVLSGKVLLWLVLFVPVQNTANKRRDQCHTCISTGFSLCQAEQQRQVTVNTALFQLCCSLNALPGRSQFDQHSIRGNAGLLIAINDPQRTVNAGTAVK